MNVDLLLHFHVAFTSIESTIGLIIDLVTYIIILWIIETSTILTDAAIEIGTWGKITIVYLIDDHLHDDIKLFLSLRFPLVTTVFVIMITFSLTFEQFLIWSSLVEVLIVPNDGHLTIEIVFWKM